MKRFDCKQLSPEWFELHRGRPTASKFDRIITPKTRKPAAGAADYILELIAEKNWPGPIESMGRATSAPMQNGIKTEEEAVACYEAMFNVDVDRVGFITTDDERFGCSPDGFVTINGKRGGLEIKCPTGKVHGRYLLDGELPADYKCQVHGGLLVAEGELEFWDFFSYCQGYRPFHVRVLPDMDFGVSLKVALDLFWAEYQATIEKLCG